MSVKIMGLVWDLDIPQNEKFVLLAYADHADHNGDNMFPSVALVAKKTGYSERSVQRTTRSLEEKGYLVANGKGPNGTNKWKFGRGDILSGVTNEAEGVTPVSPGGDIAVSPEPSLTIKEPSTTNWKKLKEEAQERKTKQRANKKDTIDFLLAESRKIEPRVQMRMRVESALRGRKPDWDAPRSVWNGYDLVLMKREEETGETIERFMEWFYEDDFRATSDIYLQPKKINDWWSRAFTDETEMRPEYKKFVAEEIKSVPNPKA